MDSLVARYSRPAAFQNETLGEDQYDDFQNDITPTLSLKFAMPPVAQVSSAEQYWVNFAGMQALHLLN